LGLLLLTLLGRKERERERERNFLLCEILPLYDKTKKKKEKKKSVELNQRIFLGKKWDKVCIAKILQDSLNYKLSVLICLPIRSWDWGCIHSKFLYKGGTLIGPSTSFLKHLALPQQI
jgi:hypothetical protein